MLAVKNKSFDTIAPPRVLRIAFFWLVHGVPWIVLAVGVAGIAAVNPIDARKRMEIFIVGRGSNAEV